MSHEVSFHASTSPCAGLCVCMGAKGYIPDLQTYLSTAEKFDYVPLYSRMPIPNLNPVQLFAELNPIPPACLLESLTGKENGRYSIIARQALKFLQDPPGKRRTASSLQAFLETTRVPRLDFPFFYGGVMACWSYDQSLLEMDLRPKGDKLAGDYFFMPGEVLVYDRNLQELTVILWRASDEISLNSFAGDCRHIKDLLDLAQSCCGECPQEKNAETRMLNLEGFRVNIEADEYCSMVEQAKEFIQAGDVLQVVLARRWEKPSSADPWKVYQQLRRLNPSPYMFYLYLPEFTLMGSSPEMMVKVEEGLIKTRPIAGTRKFTGNRSEDLVLEKELIEDEKERAEHLMLVDLACSELGQISTPESIRVSHLMQVERYSHVMHLVSTVEGKLKKGLDALEGFKACFPAGTLTGAPKRRAMEIIAMLEKEDRGVYGGAIGYVAFNGNLDSCITIRSILCRQGLYTLQSGAGIIDKSIPAREEQETFNKARALMIAISLAELEERGHETR